MERQDLPNPASLHDIYMHDQCLSLRAIVDLLTPKAPEPQAATELREPEMTGAVQVERKAQQGPTVAAQKQPEPVAPRRQAKE